MHLAQMKGPVNHWVQNRVGETDESQGHHRLARHLFDVEESEAREEDIVWRPADDEGGHDHYGHAQRFPLGLPE